VRGEEKAGERYLRIEATSMIRGMSREKPAEDLVLWILHIWSAYDVTGEEMRLVTIEC
jgi:hypothetical protein